MLHILFLILKIIGIILAVILGILVLLVCIVLFVPVRYQGKATCDGAVDTLYVAAKATWLFSLIRFYCKYEDQKARYTIRIGWKRIAGGQTYVEEETKETDGFQKEKANEFKKDKASGKDAPKDIPKEEPEKVLKDEQKNIQEIFQKAEKESQNSFTQKIKQFFSGWKKKLSNIQNKIKCTFTNICDKIKALSKKKDTIVRFLQDADHKKAFVKIKKEIWKLLGRLKPRKKLFELEFGFEDPSTTGYALAGLAVLYPFFGDDMKITPDFEHSVLKGKLMVKGKIYIIHFICIIWNLLWYKPVRQSYKDIRDFKW